MDVSLNTCLLNLVFPYWYLLLFKVYPEEGLSVQLDGTASNGSPPTTESPTILQIDWRCKFLFLYLCHMPSYIKN
jgi:hypothetical protein